jgi:uncharacterized protein YbjT (DUF2867 family)
VVSELLQSSKCGSVVVTSRRSIPESAYAETFPSLPAGADTSKLTIAEIDYERMTDEGAHADVFRGAHFVVSTLGTSPYTKRVDLDYSNAGARLAAAAGTVTHFSLVTSQGASASSWIGYLKVKGQQEEYARTLGFPRLALFRPGALDRGPLRDARFKEKLMGWIGMKGIRVGLVGRAIRMDAEGADASPGEHIFGNDDISAKGAAQQ